MKRRRAPQTRSSAMAAATNSNLLKVPPTAVTIETGESDVEGERPEDVERHVNARMPTRKHVLKECKDFRAMGGSNANSLFCECGSPLRDHFHEADATGEACKCKCGLPICHNRHKQAGSSSPQSKTATREQPVIETQEANAYGKMHFLQEQTGANYFRIDWEVAKATSLSIKKVWRNLWRLPLPNIIVNIIVDEPNPIGDAKNTGSENKSTEKKMKREDPLTLFWRNFLPIVLDCDGWICTPVGKNDAMQKLVVEFKKNLLPAQRYDPTLPAEQGTCIGIAPWRLVNNRHMLVNNNYKRIALYDQRTSDATGIALDTNHTHFLLLDGIYDKSDVNLVNQTREIQLEFQKTMNPCPMFCCVLVGGKAKALDEVWWHLMERNADLLGKKKSAVNSAPTPPKKVDYSAVVILVKDSGGLAKVIAEVHEKLKALQKDGKELKGKEAADALMKNHVNDIKKSIQVEMICGNQNEDDAVKKIVEIVAEKGNLLVIVSYGEDSKDEGEDTENTKENTAEAEIKHTDKMKEDIVRAYAYCLMEGDDNEEEEAGAKEKEKEQEQEQEQEQEKKKQKQKQTQKQKRKSEEFVDRKLKGLINLSTIWKCEKVIEEKSFDEFRYEHIQEMVLDAILMDKTKLLSKDPYKDVTKIDKKRIQNLSFEQAVPVQSLFADMLINDKERRDKGTKFKKIIKVVQVIIGEDISPPEKNKCASKLKCCKSSNSQENKTKNNSDRTQSSKPPEKPAASETQGEKNYSCCCCSPSQPPNNNPTDGTYKLEALKETDVSPEFKLFLFSVLLNRTDMAKTLWGWIEEPLAAALLAVKILRKMASFARSIDEQSEFEESAKQFEKLASQLISQCYDKNREAAFTLLIRAVSCIGNRTCLDLAKSAEALDFVSEKCVQALCSRLWFGDIRGSDTVGRNITIFLSCFTLIPLFSLKYEFHDTQQVFASKEHKKSISKNGIAKKAYSANGRRPVNEFISPILKFYDAPVAKFTCTILVHMAFLLAASYDLLIQYNAYNLKYTSFTENYLEWYLVIYVASLAMEELLELFQEMGSGCNLRFYVKDWWNVIDWSAIILFAAGILLGNIPGPAESQIALLGSGRVFYACSLILFYIKILQWFMATQEFGEKVYLVGRMMRELASFWAIFLVFIAAWGVAQWALLFPQSAAQWSLIRDVLQMSFWELLQQFYSGQIRQFPFDGRAACTNDSRLYNNYTSLRCSDEIGQNVVPILLGAYAVFMSFLLVNLLISLFGRLIENQEITKKQWQFESLRLVLTFVCRSRFVPPFTILSLIFWAFNACIRSRCKCRNSSSEKVIYPTDYLPPTKVAYGSSFSKDRAELLHYHDTPFCTWMTKMRDAVITKESKINSLDIGIQTDKSN